MGGAERVTYDLVQRLDKSEYEVVFATFYGPGPMGEVFRESGYRLYDNLLRNKYNARGLFRLKKIVAEHRIDLIYILTQPVTLLWGVIFARLCGVPLIALVSSPIVVREHPKLQVYRLLMPFVDRVIAVAEIQKNQLVQEIGVTPHLVSVIHNGVDVRRFGRGDGASVRREAGFRPDSKIVGLVARLVRLKAVDVLLHAAKLVTDQRSGVEFAVVGTGPELPGLRALARSLGLESHVRFTGFVEEPADIIGCFEIGVLCSRTEALPIAILEYMAAGIPCVATDVGGVRELVADGDNGFLLEPDDPAGLAGKIIELLDDPGLGRRMGGKSRERVTKQFTMDAMVHKTATAFHEVVRHR